MESDTLNTAATVITMMTSGIIIIIIIIIIINVPKSFETSGEGKDTTLWNQSVRTDSTIPNSKPDITLTYLIHGAESFLNS